MKKLESIIDNEVLVQYRKHITLCKDPGECNDCLKTDATYNYWVELNSRSKHRTDQPVKFKETCNNIYIGTVTELHTEFSRTQC